MNICTIDGCTSKREAKGYCQKHYHRVRKTGTPDGGHGTRKESFTSKTAPAQNGCIEWNGWILKTGYGGFWDGTRSVRAHRYAWEQANGPIPEGMVIDHMCWNRSCVNVKHLRVVTTKQNAENMGKLRSDSESGYRGVSWSKAARKWSAYISHHGKRIYLGIFANKEEANHAAIEARNKYFTHNDLDRTV